LKCSKWKWCQEQQWTRKKLAREKINRFLRGRERRRAGKKERGRDVRESMKERDRDGGRETELERD
jgi:hypothetical protein